MVKVTVMAEVAGGGDKAQASRGNGSVDCRLVAVDDVERNITAMEPIGSARSEQLEMQYTRDQGVSSARVVLLPYCLKRLFLLSHTHSLSWLQVAS